MPWVTVLAEAEGVADRQHHVADRDLLRVGEADRREVLELDVQRREIRRRIPAHDLRRRGASVTELHLDRVGTGDHVVVGEDVAIGAEDDAGAEGALDALARHAAGNTAEEQVLEERVAPRGDALGGEDIDNRRRGGGHGGTVARGRGRRCGRPHPVLENEQGGEETGQRRPAGEAKKAEQGAHGRPRHEWNRELYMMRPVW
jgi:hypothetical protein